MLKRWGANLDVRNAGGLGPEHFVGRHCSSNRRSDSSCNRYCARRHPVIDAGTAT